MADALQGTWVFNDVPILQDASWQLSFNSNGEDFTKVVIEKTALETLDGGIVYKSYNNGTIDKSVIAYGGDEPDAPTEWNNEAYKTITITSKLSEVTNGSELLTWLQANATKQVAPSPAYPKINSFTYHGKQVNNINGKPIRYVHYMGNTYEMVYADYLADANGLILQDANGNNLEFTEA